VKSQPAAFRTQERSQTPQRGFLYRFDYEGTSYYWTRWDKDLTVTGGPVSKMADPQVFASGAIAHSNTEESVDAAPSGVVVSISANDPQLTAYFLTVAPKRIDVEIWRVSSSALAAGTLAYDDDLWMVFRGVVDAVGFEGQVISARCSTLLSQEDRQVPNFYFQKTCNSLLYDQTPGACQVNPALFNVATSAAAVNRPGGYVDISQTSISVGSPSRSVTITPETFQGGVVVDSDGNRMSVLACDVLPAAAGTRLYLAFVPRSLAASDSITVFCGCLHIKRTCHELFRNLPNFAGTPYIPITNPAIDGVTT